MSNPKLVDNPLRDILSRKLVGLDTDGIDMTGIEGGEQRVFPCVMTLKDGASNSTGNSSRRWSTNPGRYALTP
jgi:hypothetical protein